MAGHDFHSGGDNTVRILALSVFGLCALGFVIHGWPRFDSSTNYYYGYTQSSTWTSDQLGCAPAKNPIGSGTAEAMTTDKKN